MAFIQSVDVHDVTLLPPRFALGASMLFHGAGKLRGEGPAQTGAFFEQLNIRPPRFWALATGISEFLAGTFAFIGFATRPAAIAVLVTQAVALGKVHAKNGFDITKGGFEYNLALMGMALALLVEGPGELSLHEVLERSARGRSPKRLLRRVRPGRLERFLKLIK